MKSGSLFFSLIFTKHLSYELNCQIVANTKPDQVNHSILRRALRKDKTGRMINKRKYMFCACLTKGQRYYMHVFFHLIFMTLQDITNWNNHFAMGKSEP